MSLNKNWARGIISALGYPEIAGYNNDTRPKYTFLAALAGRPPHRSPDLAHWNSSKESNPEQYSQSMLHAPAMIFSLIMGVVLGATGSYSLGLPGRPATPYGSPADHADVQKAFKVDGSAIGATFGPHGTLAVATASGNVTLLNLYDENKRMELGSTGSGPVTRAVFSPRGTTLAVGSVDGTVRIWPNALESPEAPKASLPMQENGDYAGAVNDLAYSPNGRILAVASSTSLVRIWDVSNPSKPRPLASSNEQHLVTRLAFNASGNILAVGSTDSTVQLWDVSNPRHPRDFYGEIKALTGVTALAFSSDKKTLAVGSSNGSVQLWNISSPENPVKIADAKAVGYTNDLAFNGQGYILAASNTDGTVRLWEDLDDLMDPRVLTRRTHQGELSSVTFDNTENTLAVTGTDGSVQLWTA